MQKLQQTSHAKRILSANGGVTDMPRHAASRPTLALIQSGPSGATWRFHGRGGCCSSDIAGRALPASKNCKTESGRTCKLKWKHRQHAKYGHGKKDQSRSPAETSSHCKAVGSSSETDETPCSVGSHCKAVGSSRELEHIEITYESHERLQLHTTQEARVILTAWR